GGRAGWMPDASTAAIPNQAAGGMVHGESFNVQLVEITGGAPKESRGGSHGHWTYFVKLPQGTKFFAHKSFHICVLPKPGQTLELKSYRVKPGSTFEQANPVMDGNTSYPPVQGVFMAWNTTKDDLPKTEILAEKYSLNLSFGKTSGNLLPGRIYLCAQD